ncbi:hypothetical protein [Marinobacter sp.]|uniref:hypothetical protein n=1 Tax=Marinobacter sp. TaxID=50741 RepID=UPI00384B3EED
MNKTATRIAGSSERIFAAWRLIREDVVHPQPGQGRRRASAVGQRTEGKVASGNAAG